MAEWQHERVLLATVIQREAIFFVCKRHLIQKKAEIEKRLESKFSMLRSPVCVWMISKYLLDFHRSTRKRDQGRGLSQKGLQCPMLANLILL